MEDLQIPAGKSETSAFTDGQHAAIITRYHQPTDKRPARMSAIAYGNKRRYYAYDHRLSTERNHRLAAGMFAAFKGWDKRGRDGQGGIAGNWHGGHLPNLDYAWTWTEEA